MDTLRLLTRSSGLKFGKGQQRDAQPLPSSGSKNISEDIAQSNAELKSSKRKRDEFEASLNDGFLTESEIRQVHKQHKIKITDLRELHSESLSSRKVQKQSSRLFPSPLQSFSQLSKFKVNKTLISNIASQAYREPTEVQLATIPLLLEDSHGSRDLLTVAPTGSGKTLAFLIPLIDHTSKLHHASEQRHVSALILAPTKELVSQIVNEGRKLTANTGVRITELRKGMRLLDGDNVQDVDVSDDDLDQAVESTGTVVKADIIVSTPLSLVNAITPRDMTSPSPLPDIHNLIFDEADVLLDPLFREQTLSLWSACTSTELRVSLWSATIGSSIEELAISTIDSRLEDVQEKSQTQSSLIRTVIGLKDSSLPSISHRLIYASTEPGKLMGLRQLIHPSSSITNSKQITTSTTQTILRPPFLIFTQSIERAQSLHRELRYDIPPSAGGSTRIAVLHSSLSTKQRSDTMTSFRQGKIWILITTDLLSRGVDFRGVNGVVNYDIPTTSASYVHRAGRTGRAGRDGGICVTLYTRDDVKYLKPIANIISASEKNTNSSSSSSANMEGLPSWLIPSLPHLTKSSKKDLKARGVDVRRGVKESDNDKERKTKLKNRIGTTSGYERKLQDRRKGMVEGSKRRKAREGEDEDEDEDHWDGLGD